MYDFFVLFCFSHFLLAKGCKCTQVAEALHYLNLSIEFPLCLVNSAQFAKIK